MMYLLSWDMTSYVLDLLLQEICLWVLLWDRCAGFRQL